MFYVYILQSLSNRHYYVGMTADIKKRIEYHNHGANKYTRRRGPWKLIYFEKYWKKIEALNREHQIKSYKGGEAFKKLLNIGEVA